MRLKPSRCLVLVPVMPSSIYTVQKYRHPVSTSDMVTPEITFLVDKKIYKQRIAQFDIDFVHWVSSMQPELLLWHVHDQGKPFPIVRVTQNRKGRRYRQRVIRLNTVFLFRIPKDFLTGYHFASFFADFFTSS